MRPLIIYPIGPRNIIDQFFARPCPAPENHTPQSIPESENPPPNGATRCSSNSLPSRSIHRRCRTFEASASKRRDSGLGSAVAVNNEIASVSHLDHVSRSNCTQTGDIPKSEIIQGDIDALTPAHRPAASGHLPDFSSQILYACANKIHCVRRSEAASQLRSFSRNAATRVPAASERTIPATNHQHVAESTAIDFLSSVRDVFFILQSRRKNGRLPTTPPPSCSKAAQDETFPGPAPGAL